MSDHHPEDRLVAFARGELGDHLATLVAEHLDGCPRCANMALRHDPLARMFASLDEPTPPAALIDLVLAQVAQVPLGAPPTAADTPAIADTLPTNLGGAAPSSAAVAWLGVALLALAATLAAALLLTQPSQLVAAARLSEAIGHVLLRAAADPRVAAVLAAGVACAGTTALLTARAPVLRRFA